MFYSFQKLEMGLIWHGVCCRQFFNGCETQKFSRSAWTGFFFVVTIIFKQHFPPFIPKIASSNFTHTHFSSTILLDSFIFLVYEVVLGLVYGTLLFSFGKPVVLVRPKWRPFKDFHTEIFYFLQLFIGKFTNVSQSKTWRQLAKLLDS